MRGIDAEMRDTVDLLVGSCGAKGNFASGLPLFGVMTAHFRRDSHV
jgi:hypothetical protein